MKTMDSEKIWKVIFVASVTMVRIGQGMYLSIPGPTLLFLAELYSVDVSRLSLMFTLRSLGMMFGAAAYSAIMYRFKKFNPLSATGPGALVLGLVTALIPWYNNFAGLLAANFISGFMFSLFDGAMQTLYLRIWTEEDVGPYIQSFHFGISLGGALTPLFATPFLQMADQAGDSDPSCPTPIMDVTSTVPTMVPTGYSNCTTSAPLDIDSINPVSWSYVIVGGFSILASLPLFGFWASGLDGRIVMRGSDSQGGQNEEPIRDVWPVILLLGFYYFFNDALEATYGNYIYSVAYCMDIGFTVTQAGRLNFMFWSGYTISRLVAIGYSKYFEPRTIIIYSIILNVAVMVVLCIFGQDISLVLWISTLFFGLSVATYYPTGVTWASRVTDISGKYMFVFMFSAGLDSMVILPLAGVLFELKPFYVMYLITGAAIGIGLVFIGLEIVARRHSEMRVAHKQLSHDEDGNICVKEQTKL